MMPRKKGRAILNAPQRNLLNTMVPIANLFSRPSAEQYGQQEQDRLQQAQQQARNQSFGFEGGSFNALPQQGDFWHGSPGGLLNIDNNTPEQEGYLNSLLQHLQGGAQNLDLPGNQLQGDQQQNQWQNFSNEAQRNFGQKTIPGLAERFAGMGSGGGLNSSAFANSLSSASSDLQSQLAALGGQYGQQQQQLNLNQMD